MSDTINYDEIARRLKGALWREDSGDLEDLEEGGRRARIPYDRFAAVRRERDQARKELEEISAAVEHLRTSHTSALAELREAAAKEVQALQARHLEDLALVDQGFRDPLGRAALRQAWEAAPAGERGKSAAKWWSEMMSARAAYAAGEAEAAPSIPATLKGYLPAEAEPPPARSAVRPPPGAPQARAPGPGELPQADNMADWLRALQG